MQKHQMREKKGKGKKKGQKLNKRLFERKWEETLRDKVCKEKNRWDKTETEMRRALVVCYPLSLLHCYVSQHTETLSHKHGGAEPEPRWSMVWMQWQQKISLPDHIQATVLAVLASASLISIKSNSPLQSPLWWMCWPFVGWDVQVKISLLPHPSLSPTQPSDHGNHDE